MHDFPQFLESLGTLHDCTVVRLDLDAAAETLSFDIEDIYWNFEGTPVYRGPVPGRIVLEGVKSLRLDVQWDSATPRHGQKFLISEFTAAVQSDGGFVVTVFFWAPGPGSKITARCARATFPVIDPI
ncbi:hypothetical protein BH10PSE9_BH10PSE9_18550 [soil metagenome]